jgi:molecular chaperone HtpG
LTVIQKWHRLCQKNIKQKNNRKMQNGTINVQTENIFPIIKKFLYSDHEIFLRELVSNAVDACQKLKTLSSVGEFKGELGNLRVEVIIDEKNKTLTIRDNGVGMSQEEVDKYINQIAFSGAEEFVNKYQEQDNAIIGHFGLGFYSSFMVSKEVTIISKSFRDDKAVTWTCDGSPNYNMGESDKAERGTDIVMQIADDSTEFLEESRIKGILDKYCKFLPVDIKFGTNEHTEKEKDAEGKEVEGGKETKIVEDNIVNNTQPTWIKAPAELKDENYTSFYKELYPYAEDPMFHIHLNVDYPFNLTGILYFPKFKNNMDMNRNKIQLYSNQVFITDSVEEIVPDFLTLLHGVIDSPDIPLNVSRSYLQSDANVKKISNHISKKVADKLQEMFKNKREEFEAKWDDIKIFMEYGMLSDDKFYDRAAPFFLFKNTEGKFFTLEEYKEKITALQTDKDGNVICLYASNADEQHSFIEAAKDRSYDVLLLETPLTAHLVGKLEQKNEKTTFVRVDGDTMDNLIKKDEETPSKLSKEQEEALKPVFEGVVSKSKFTVEVKPLDSAEGPVIITQPEFMRRMKEQQAVGGGNPMFGMMPEMYQLVVNANHTLVTELVDMKEEVEKKELSKQMVDLAMLGHGLLKGADLTNFIKRSVSLISKA